MKHRKHVVLKENQPRMWDVREYELVVPGHPTQDRRVSVGRPKTTSEYSRTSHNRGSFSFYYMSKLFINSP